MPKAAIRNAAACGLVYRWRRKRRMELQREFQAALLNAAEDSTAEVEAYVLQ